ncbi:MAG: YicC family protein [Lachnospiraceae bacterium]|nr:YicC family protein [Lachnospiraceae bacterium]
MINSMTGFGRFEASGNSRKFTAEIKSVNHRYLDFNIKMPKLLNPFEGEIRKEVKQYAQRGKVDLYITMENEGDAVGKVLYNKSLAAQYYECLAQMAMDFGLENDIRVSHLSRYPDVFTMEEEQTDENELWQELSIALKGALEMFADSRKREGEHLRHDLLEKCGELEKHVLFIKEHSPEILNEYRATLREKMLNLLEDRQIDESRLLMETALFADKVCVDEEIVRLSSHIQAVKKDLEAGGAIGRKLDFLAQEMNREANTILSKTNNIEISNRGIEIKTSIEKIREQIQNIE